MPDKSNNPFQFWEELKRRRVIRVITVYAAAAFVLLELVDIISEPLRLPDWTINFVLVLLCIGFIISVILSWIYDVTPEGIEKTKPSKEVVSVEVQPASTGWKITSFVSILIIIAFIVFYVISNIKQSSDISKLEKSIAVLPFENMSVGEEYSHLGGAFTDEIILELQKIKEFDRVLSRTSTMQYEDSRPTIPEIAEKLGVNYIIEGSIQRHKEDVSIRVQVIRAEHEDHIWADEFDGKWEDIFSIQDEIALHVANELKTFLSPEEIEQIDKQPTDNLEAYDLYLKGRFFWHRRTEVDLKKSINYFEQALELDSTYALAYVGLADVYFIMPWYSSYSSNDAFIKAKEFAENALSINKNIAEAHSTLGALAIYHEWNWKLAEKELKLAIKLNPKYYVAHQSYFELLNILGRSIEAEEQIDLAIKYNPNFFIILNQRAGFYYQEGRYEEAVEEFKKVLEIKYWFSSMSGILKCYLKQSKDKESIRQVKAIIARNDSINHDKLFDEIYQKAGIDGIIHLYLDWMLLNKPGQLTTIASFYAIIGDEQKAIEYLEKLVESDQLGKPYINFNPDFNILRTEPRFIALLEKMNLK